MVIRTYDAKTFNFVQEYPLTSSKNWIPATAPKTRTPSFSLTEPSPALLRMYNCYKLFI